MQNRNILTALAVIATGLLAFLLVYQILARTPRPSSSQRAPLVAARQRPGRLQRTDESGNTWVLTLASGQPLSGAADGAQAGPLLTVKTDVQWRGANEAAIGLVLEGAGGERYRPGVMKNGVTLPAPGLKIVDEQANVLVEDNFRYG